MGYKQLEVICKGVASHRRVQTLVILARTPHLSLNDIAHKLNTNFRTASEHIRRMVAAGLVEKRQAGRSVQHSLSRRGKNILSFLGKLE